MRGQLARHAARLRRFLCGLCRHLSTSQVEIALKYIEDVRWELVTPFVLLGVGPSAIQANGVGQVFRERLPVRSITHENVAEPAPGSGIISTTTRASVGI